MWRSDTVRPVTSESFKELDPTASCLSGPQDQGNDLFKRALQLKKKFFLQQAIVKYTEGLKIEGLPRGSTMSTLLSNRSQAHLRLLNHRSALEDALAAVSIDSKNVKVCKIYEWAVPSWPFFVSLFIWVVRASEAATERRQPSGVLLQQRNWATSRRQSRYASRGSPLIRRRQSSRDCPRSISMSSAGLQ